MSSWSGDSPGFSYLKPRDITWFCKLHYVQTKSKVDQFSFFIHEVKSWDSRVSFCQNVQNYGIQTRERDVAAGSGYLLVQESLP
jgi:hypothetical protein